MNKKILFGSIFVLVMILLMPSIPAIQHKTIEDNAYNDFIEKIKEINLEDIKELDGLRHPILFIIFFTIVAFRGIRVSILLELSTNIVPDPAMPFRIIVNPLIFLKCFCLSLRMLLFVIFWLSISEILGWNWDL